MFNEADMVTVGQLKSTTTMPKENFNAGMMQLCNPKIKVLMKQFPKPDFSKDEEQIKANPKFAQNNIRINLIPQRVYKKKTTEKTEEEVK